MMVRILGDGRPRWVGRHLLSGESVNFRMSQLSRRGLAAVGGIALAAGLAVVPIASQPAQAACYNRVQLPDKVTINSYYKQVTVKLRTTCQNLDYAAVTLFGPNGAEDWFTWDRPRTDKTEYWDVYDWWTPLGSYRTRDGYAWSTNFNDLPISGDSTKVKLGSAPRMTTARKGEYVTVNFSTRRYFTAYSQWRDWGGAKVNIQYRKDGDWKWLTSPTTNRYGDGSWRFKAGVRTYRVCVQETATVWSSCSGIGRR